MTLAAPVRLPRQIATAVEGLIESVEVAAGAVVRALHCLTADESDLGTGLVARHTAVGRNVAVDVDAARAVVPRARDVVTAAAGELLGPACAGRYRIQ